MPSQRFTRFWHRFRLGFRRARITFLLLLLVAVSGMAYLDLVGLPGFLKRPLLAKLRAHGLELRFSRLRLSWFHGIVAQNVHFGRADRPFSPQLTLGEIRVLLNLRALARLRLQVDSLALRRGRLVWPVQGADGQPSLLSLEDIESDLRFRNEDDWLLDNFKARFAGARVRLFGTLAHASALQKWTFPEGRQPSSSELWQNRLRQLAEVISRTQFSSPPELRLDVRGDAHDLRLLSARMRLSTAGAQTPWGTFTQGRINARLSPATNAQLSSASVTLDANDAQTQWATHRPISISPSVSLRRYRIPGSSVLKPL